VPGVETWDALRARRNVRVYEDRPLPAADLDRVLEAGWRAPSASNRQHWDFVVVTDRGKLVDLSTVWIGARHLAGAAAAVVVVLPIAEEERQKLTDQFDAGQAIMMMMLAAADLGIGSGHSAVGDQDAARALLGIPAAHLVAFMLALGYPSDRPLAPIVRPNRRPIEDVVHRGAW
jgi:nitroreductase